MHTPKKSIFGASTRIRFFRNPKAARVYTDPARVANLVVSARSRVPVAAVYLHLPTRAWPLIKTNCYSVTRRWRLIKEKNKKNRKKKKTTADLSRTTNN